MAFNRGVSRFHHSYLLLASRFLLRYRRGGGQWRSHAVPFKAVTGWLMPHWPPYSLLSHLHRFACFAILRNTRRPEPVNR